MATYILFWNPDISSYTMERFQEDFEDEFGVGNWSFHEHEKVKYGDTFYLVKCGSGRTGIVMQGIITSRCYEDEDWSPKKRAKIYYANIIQEVTINPESEAVLLTPDFLTEELPDFNWYGGHSGRRLSPDYARKLDKIWAEYLQKNPQMFCNHDAYLNYYYDYRLTAAMRTQLHKSAPKHCEICGYEYSKILTKEEMKKYDINDNRLIPVTSPLLNRLFFSICHNCRKLPEELKVEKLKQK